MSDFTPVPDETLRELLELEAKIPEMTAERGNAGSEHPLFLVIPGSRGGRRLDSDDMTEFVVSSRNSIRAIVLDLLERREREGELLTALKMYVEYRSSGLAGSSSRHARAKRGELNDAIESAIRNAERKS